MWHSLILHPSPPSLKPPRSNFTPHARGRIYETLEIIGLERYSIRYESDSDEIQNLTTFFLS